MAELIFHLVLKQEEHWVALERYIGQTEPMKNYFVYTKKWMTKSVFLFISDQKKYSTALEEYIR